MPPRCTRSSTSPKKVNADLLVVGNVGLNARSAMLGRVFSVPGNIASKAACDVLIVHTSG